MKYRSGPTELEPPPVRETPPEPPEPARLPALVAHGIALCVGVLGLMSALALPFAPVWTDLTDVHWPSRTAPAHSTTAFFAPYRPATFTAVVPCWTIGPSLAKPERTTIFSTMAPNSDRDGMLLTTERGEPHLVLGQHTVPLPPLTPGCNLTVRADAQHTEVKVGQAPVITLPRVAAPEIFTFSTDLPPERAAGISVTARTFSWFDTTPTESKYQLLMTTAVTAVLSLVLLLVHAPPSLAALRRRLTWRGFGLATYLLLIDGVIGAVLAGWGIIGPLTDDDGFAMMTIRNFANTGDVGNFYRWFNASETPFTLLQYLMHWVAGFSLAPAALRVPSVIAGFLTWLVVSRGVVAPLCRDTRRAILHPLTAVFFLALWMPFDLGIRPEAFLALGLTLTVALLLKATSDQASAPYFWLGCAALVTGLTVAITPTGIAAILTVLVFIPRIYRLLVRRGVVGRWLAIPTRLALIGCAASAGILAMFADSTLNGVKQATAIHNEFGPSLGWYQEIGRYTALLGTNSWGSAGKRIAVFLTVAALLIAGAAAMRQTHRWTRLPALPLVLGSVAAVFVTLWLTPSKWTHHFGALAGVGAALLTGTVVLLGRVGKRPLFRREARLLGGFGALAASVAAGLSYMGPNSWWVYSDIAMPWSDTPVHPTDLALDSPVFWLGIAGATAALTFALTRFREFGRSLRPNRTREEHWANLTWTSMPSAVLSLAAVTSIIVLIGSFLAAAETMGDRFTMAHVNWDSTVARSCGIEDYVETLPLAQQHTLAREPGQDELKGFTADGGLPASGPPQEPDLHRDPDGTLSPASNDAVTATPYVWGSFQDSPQSTGSLVSTWFTLPPLKPDQTLSVWVAGRPEQGNTLSLEFGSTRGKTVLPAGQRALIDPPPSDLPFDDPRQGRPIDWRDFRPWRLLTVSAHDIPAGAQHVRVRAVDGTTDPQGWLGVSAPVIRDVVPLRHMLDGHSPALIDWPISFAFPCRWNYPRVSHGTADSPALLVTPSGGEGSMAFDPEVGGVFAGLPQTSRRLETPSRLKGASGVPWGHVFSVGYDIDRDVYDVAGRRVRMRGAGGDGGYPFKDHP